MKLGYYNTSTKYELFLYLYIYKLLDLKQIYDDVIATVNDLIA